MAQKHSKPCVKANLSDIFKNSDAGKSHIGNRLQRMIKESHRVLKPPFPRQIQIETTNICNHSCIFCAYTLMRRKKSRMPSELFRRLATEAYECGAREIGLFAGAEPLASPQLVEYVTFCRDLGYEYQYISTNGALGSHSLLASLFDAGLNSIKFSINGGTRERFKLVHGRDDFDKVISNVKFVSEYRESRNLSFYLGVSCVGMPDDKESFTQLEELLGEFVDEMIYYKASNQSGQMPELPPPPYRDCHLPFNKAHFSVEGFLKACCNDYENYLAIEDLSSMSLQDAWSSERFQELRRKHIENNLDGVMCGNCIRRSKVTPKPINSALIKIAE